MEHRLEDRVTAPICVAIHTTQRDTYKTRVRNLSTGGAQVHIDSTWDIRKINVVLIEFMEELISVKIPALVIWTSAMSASLMFIERVSELHAYLRHEKSN
ncbi:MAG: PilZ domain-containing protein [Gammaproteobacteria bacterium]